MSFASPIFLVTLVIVPITLAYALIMYRRRARYPLAFTNMEVLSSVVETRRTWKRWVPLVFLLLALTTAATAVARPQARMSTSDEHATIVLLVDVSGSMRATDVKPSRLDAAVGAMRTFLDQLPKKYKVGLVAFSSTAEVLQTPTDDHDPVFRGLGYLAPEAGTALGDGIVTATRLIVSSLAAVGVQHDQGKFLPAAIVLESDGAQNRGTISPIKAAQAAKIEGVRVYGVALGTPKGKVSFGFGLYESKVPVPPDPVTVAKVSQITGGKSFTAKNSDQILKIYKDLGSNLGRKTELREITSWFAIATAVLLVVAVGLSRLWAAPLP
jgi:Ca-activated chloride channel family protein